MKFKTNAATESKALQTREGIQKAAAKTLEDMKYFFKFSFKVSIFLLVTLVPISIFCCWYSPTHRVKTSKQSPQWGKVIDLILDEIEDEVKSIKGTPIEQSKNLIKELLLKEEVSSFQDSVDAHRRVGNPFQSLLPSLCLDLPPGLSLVCGSARFLAV